jgi:hypothetical protein
VTGCEEQPFKTSNVDVASCKINNSYRLIPQIPAGIERVSGTETTLHSIPKKKIADKRCLGRK